MKNYDLVDKEKFHNECVEFSFFAKKVLSQMKALKKAIQAFRSIKTSNVVNFKLFNQLVCRYEEVNLNTYVSHDERKLVFAHPEHSKLNN